MKNKEKIKLKNKWVHITIFIVFLIIMILSITFMGLIEKSFFDWNKIIEDNYNNYVIYNPEVTLEQFKHLNLQIQYGYINFGFYQLWVANKIIPVILIIISLFFVMFEIGNFFLKITN